MTVDLSMPYYVLMLVWMTLTFNVTVGHQRQKNQCLVLSEAKQALNIKLATTVCHFVRDLDFANVKMAWPSCSLILYLYSVSFVWSMNSVILGFVCVLAVMHHSSVSIFCLLSTSSLTHSWVFFIRHDCVFCHIGNHITCLLCLILVGWLNW